jgi:hypothetical protein
MASYFPTADHVRAARAELASGTYGSLDTTMQITTLAHPTSRDLRPMLTEFRELVAELELPDSDAGFIVLVPVRVSGTLLTTPILIDTGRLELSFTSHPALGADTIPAEVISENRDLVPTIREQLLGVLATWHNVDIAEDHV